MVILLYWLFAGQYQYLQTSTFQRKNKIFFILNLVGNWASLLTIRKTTGKDLKIAMTISDWKTYFVHRSGSEGW